MGLAVRKPDCFLSLGLTARSMRSAPSHDSSSRTISSARGDAKIEDATISSLAWDDVDGLFVFRHELDVF